MMKSDQCTFVQSLAQGPRAPPDCRSEASYLPLGARPVADVVICIASNDIASDVNSGSRQGGFPHFPSVWEICTLVLVWLDEAGRGCVYSLTCQHCSHRSME